MVTRPRELPMLAGIAGALEWVETLLSLLNGPLLMFGAGIAIVDLLTDGALTVAAPVLLFAWAVSQALGIDTQLLACFARARGALRERAGWAMVGWLALGAILAYFGWQAGYVFAVQQAQHITEARALAQLGMPAALWLGERAALAVGLVALSGWTRYHPPAEAPAVEDAEARRMRREAEVEAAAHKVRMQAIRAAGLRQGLQALRGEVDPLSPTDDDDPDDGGLPLQATGTDGPVTPPNLSALPAPATRPLRLRGVPRDRITADGLSAYLLREMSVEISDDEALAFVRAQPGAERLSAVTGRPWAAPKAQTLRRARDKWASRASIMLTAEAAG